jgi:hypothetical protein
MTSQPKDHHFVQQGYLKAWCDPNTRPGQDPFVWLFRKDSGQAKAKAPKKILFERHLYSETRADGTKDALLESSFHEVENSFVKVRERILRREELHRDEIACLHLYVAVQQQRVPVWRDRVREPLSEMLALAKEIRAHIPAMTAEQRRSAEVVAKLASMGGTPPTSEEAVRVAHEYPFHTIMWPTATAIAAFLAENKSLLIAFAPPSRAFITTDNPCVTLDLADGREPSLYTPGLAHPDVAVLFPLAPACAAFFHTRKPVGRAYGTVVAAQVDHWNTVLASAASGALVFNAPVIHGLAE